jgi:hypothetical protein
MLKSVSLFIFTSILGATLSAMFSACSHTPVQTAQTSSEAQDWSHASVDIHYVLRHSDRRITLEADEKGVHGKSLMDGAQLKQCQIDATRYLDFITKVRNFISQRRTIASTASSQISPDCRAPYTITLKNQKDTMQIQGCRIQDEGAFSRLVQEGEFLIYRQK